MAKYRLPVVGLGPPTGGVDALSLFFEAMPAAVMRCLHHDYVVAPDRLADLPAEHQPDLQQIPSLLRSEAGQDFRHYKTGAVLRRIN